MNYPRNVTNHSAVQLMMKLENHDKIFDGDAWFTTDVYDAPILKGFITPKPTDDNMNILYRYELMDDQKLGWKKKSKGEVSL